MNWSLVFRRWVLAALLVTGAIIAWRGGSLAHSSGRAIAGIDAGLVDSLTVVSRGSTSTFTADGLAWQQVVPYRCVADALAIRDTIDVLATLPAYQSFAVEAIDRAALGLDQPVATLELGGRGGAHRIDLGRRAPAGRAWVKVGNRIISTSDALHRLVVSSDPRRWRDPALFERLSPELDRIALRQGGATILLERTGQRWSMREPIQTRADAEAVGRLIDALSRVRAEAWVADLPAGDGTDLARFGLDAPAGSVSVFMTTRTLKDGEVVSSTAEQVVEWGSVVERGTGLRVARRVGSPAVVSLDERALASMDPAPESLIDGRMLEVPASAIKSIAIDGPAGQGTLERRDGQWFLVDAAHPDGTPAREPAIASLLVALTEARAMAMNEQGAPEGLARTSIAVAGFDGASLGSIAIVREGPAGRFGVECGDGLLRIYSERMLLPLEPGEYAR
ncbi:MAG: DUF4340 domain-containing protein [Planctomycetes bacterium]|nr:DUF4340 domain-containing protein [Planctomycetota bacterium]